MGNLTVNLVIVTGVADLPTIVDPIIVGMLMSYITVEWMSRGGFVSAEEHEYREQLHETPADERDIEKTRRTVRWGRALVALGIVQSAMMITWYALPWSEAAGKPATGAIMMSLLVGVCLVLCGLIGMRSARASYSEGGSS